MRRFRALFDHFHQPPRLGLRERPRFLNANSIAHLRLFLFVVSVELLILGHDFLEFRMAETAFHTDDDGLVHLVRNNFPSSFLPMLPGFFYLSFNHITSKIKRLSFSEHSTGFQSARCPCGVVSAAMASPTGCSPAANAG